MLEEAVKLIGPPVHDPELAIFWDGFGYGLAFGILGVVIVCLTIYLLKTRKGGL